MGSSERATNAWTFLDRASPADFRFGFCAATLDETSGEKDEEDMKKADDPLRVLLETFLDVRGLDESGCADCASRARYDWRSSSSRMKSPILTEDLDADDLISNAWC